MKSPATTGSPVPTVHRFLFYGIHGIFDEVIFTALYDLFLSNGGNSKLFGQSTITSFFVYGSLSIVFDRMYDTFMREHLSRAQRIAVYVIGTYIWEFTFGLALTPFGLCSWDYSHYAYNLYGLICLEYLPGWIVLAAWQDCLFKYFDRLQLVDSNKADKNS